MADVRAALPGINDPTTIHLVLDRLRRDGHVQAEGSGRTRRVLESIGHGERTFSNIAHAAGSAPGTPVKAGALGPVLRRLQEKQVVTEGRAIEPLVREALSRAAAADSLPWPEAEAVGGWCPRNFDPEIDLVGADRAPIARTVLYTGSIKWLDTAFDRHDYAALARDSVRVPGFAERDTGLVVVSRSGVRPGLPVGLTWGPDDVLAAW